MAVEKRVKGKMMGSSVPLVNQKYTHRNRGHGRGRGRGRRGKFKQDLLKEVADIVKKMIEESKVKGVASNRNKIGKKAITAQVAHTEKYTDSEKPGDYLIDSAATPTYLTKNDLPNNEAQ